MDEQKQRRAVIGVVDRTIYDPIFGRRLRALVGTPRRESPVIRRTRSERPARQLLNGSADRSFGFNRFRCAVSLGRGLFYFIRHRAPAVHRASALRESEISVLGDQDKGNSVALLVDDDTTINDAWETARDPS